MLYPRRIFSPTQYIRIFVIVSLTSYAVTRAIITPSPSPSPSALPPPLTVNTMPGKKGGGNNDPNSKKAQGNARKAEAAAAKQAAADARVAAAESAQWAQGAKSTPKKQEDAAAKKAEAAAKKAERDRLLAEEEASQPSKPKGANKKVAEKRTNKLDLAQLDEPSRPSAATAISASGIDNALDALSLTDSTSAIKLDNPPWYSEHIPSAPYDPLVLREAFEKAVIKRLMTDVPFGVLLSGGLDSSLVAAVASRHLAETKVARQWGSQLHTFCVGLKGSPDLKAAKEVADYLGTFHHEFHFTVQEGIDALDEVIYHIETYDVTTIRASTPMFLMSRKIKSLGVKMVLSGEGSDEIFGGYLYFHKAPNKEEFHLETCRKIKALHLYDCLRANKSTSAWGVEARVPFLDKNFINIAMSIDPEWKMIQSDLGRIEKWILRHAFDDDQNPYLPKHILYRQKEQFSDGVGYSWIDGLKDHANANVSDAMLMNASFVYPENTPTTKEAYYYRTIFERFFPKNAARLTVPGGPSIACSSAKAVEWDKAWSKNLDPSGRAALGVHAAAYDEGPGANSVSEDSTSMNGFPQKQESIVAATAV